MESKHHKLARSLRSGPTDRDMKPDAKIRDQLNVSRLEIAMSFMFMKFCRISI